MELILIKFLCLACFAPTVFVNGGPPAEDSIILCDGHTVSVSSAQLLQATNVYLRAGTTCTLRVLSDFHSDPQEDKLRMQVLSLQAPCGDAFLQLYDGDSRHGNALSGMICGDIGVQKTMFMSSQRNFITVDIHTFSTGFFSLSLLATATSKGYESTDFVCDNLWDIDQSLECDGYNNCGDWSDEDSFLCSDDIGNRRVIIIVACSWAVFLIVLAFVIGVMRYRRRRRLLQYTNADDVRVTSPIISAGREVGGQQTVPEYGSIQARAPYLPAASTTFLQPSPPPYSLADPGKTSGGAPPPHHHHLPPPPPPYMYSQQPSAATVYPATFAAAPPAVPAAPAAAAVPVGSDSRAATDTAPVTAVGETAARGSSSTAGASIGGDPTNYRY